MHAHAKRIYNIAPKNVLLTFEDGEQYEFEVGSAEFFQDDFQAEATRVDDAGAAYRIVGDLDEVAVGRQGADKEGWSTFGVIEAVDPVE